MSKMIKETSLMRIKHKHGTRLRKACMPPQWKSYVHPSVVIESRIGANMSLEKYLQEVYF
jgi:hypothetical protein